MNATSEARKALEAAREEELQVRLDLPKRQKAYLAAKDTLCEALKVRCQAFKERVRAAGLQTRHFSSLSEKELSMLEDDPASADVANAAPAANAAAANAVTTRMCQV